MQAVRHILELHEVSSWKVTQSYERQVVLWIYLLYFVFLTGNPRAFHILSVVPFVSWAGVQSCQHMCVWRHINATLACCCNEYSWIIALLPSAFTCRLEILFVVQCCIMYYKNICSWKRFMYYLEILWVKVWAQMSLVFCHQIPSTAFKVSV